VTHDARAAQYALHQLQVDKGQLFENTRGVAA
jgi:ABC-type lipoprotein export system ATPase subunit